jgi:2-polyprenyl-6-methoxyphenol hydroxylase-like FAD-dependent oxidoreductase
MRVAILGAGPAGLYVACLLKRHGVASDIRIFEQNPPDATFGFGVVFSDRALEFLREDDPETHALLAPQLETWQDITLSHKDEIIRIDGVGFAAIGRLQLLLSLQQRAAELGIVPRYRCAVSDIADMDDADLIIGADGVNSLLRRSADFGGVQTCFSNRFVWYGTKQRFETLTQTFKHTAAGHFNAHHYRYAPDLSTFIAEVDEKTFFDIGFDRMGDDDAKAFIERVFAEELGGHGLISNKSVWRQFPRVDTKRWAVGNKVLVGDARSTAHFSIGSGTRLAMEDAIALVRALVRALASHRGDIASALAAYEAARRPVVDKLVGAADRSAQWYERFGEHMQLDPWRFAESYIMRTGRMSRDRLAEIAPRFARELNRRVAPDS